MNVYIRCDIEGVAGLSSWDEANCDHPMYQKALIQMSKEVAACAKGAWDAGASRVVVDDFHEVGRNIEADYLPTGTELLRGISRDLFGVTGVLTQGFDVICYVGFHSAAGTQWNPTSHTIDHSVVESIHINGELIGEFEINSYAAARIGIPVLFLSGDKGICETAKKMYPQATTVPTKEGFGYAVLSRTTKDVISDLEKSMFEAVKNYNGYKPVTLPEEFDVVLRYKNHYDAKNSANFPGAKRLSETEVGFKASDYVEVLRFFNFVI